MLRLDAERLARRLRDEYPAPANYWVAFSGGLDSSVLLAALAEQREHLPASLRALHVDHGLQLASAEWAVHCEAVCRSLDIPLTCRSVDARPGKGESPEAAARQMRYAAAAALMHDQDMLLTAHHLDDQAETVMLQLMRGAGIAGIAAMPALKPFGRGWHARPLLELPRAALRRWADEHSLQWIEDPSNEQVDADRNFLRHRVLPMLAGRWPAAAGNIARTADYAGAATEALKEQAADDLSRFRIDRHRLTIEGLDLLSGFRRRAVLQHWLRGADVSPPSSRTLSELCDQLLHADDDSAVCFELHGVQLRRYRKVAWLVERPPAEPPKDPIPWPEGLESLSLPYGSVRRVWRPGGIAPEYWTRGQAEIRFRAPGFSCQPHGRRGRRSFKALAQENDIPPWQRPWLPLLFIDGRPAAVANSCVCEPFGADTETKGWFIDWSLGEQDA